MATSHTKEGERMSTPVRLHKKPTREDHLRNFNFWVQKYFYVIVFVVLVICVLSLVSVAFATGFSAVESGTMRNFLAVGV